MNIVHYTYFELNERGNGAEKRSSQIFEIITELKCSYYKFSSLKSDLKYGRYQALIAGFKYLNNAHLPLKGIRHVLRTGYEILNKVEFIKNMNKPVVIFWEMSRYADLRLPYIAKLSGVPIIAFSHNLESLVPTQSNIQTGKTGLDWLRHEIKLLGQCDHIATISKEEQWLLTLLLTSKSVQVSFLPYYPTKKIVEELRAIRVKRQSTSKSFFLVMGTVLNPPTRIGFTNLIRFLNNNQEDRTTKFIIAGYGTMELNLEREDASNVEILGEVDSNKLNELLCNCKAIVINQEPSSGALTKIQEMRIAGVPVFANDLSLRSYYNVRGLYGFRNYSELIGLTKMKNPQIPEVPACENHFNQIAELIKNF